MINHIYNVGMECEALNQWEVARVMEGLIDKTAEDLTDEEKTKVNQEFVSQGLRMCSLRAKLYCLNNTKDDIAKGTCADCKDLQSSNESTLKYAYIELCNRARSIAQRCPLAAKKEVKITTTIPPPKP